MKAGDRCAVGGRLGSIWNVHRPQIEARPIDTLERMPGRSPGAGLGVAFAEVFFDDGGVLPEHVPLHEIEAVPSKSNSEGA